MKKTYEKPQVCVEYFALSQNIANCGAAHLSDIGGPNHWSKTTCGWDWHDGTSDIAWASNPPCTELYGETAEINGICYNNPGGGYTIFSS